MNIDEVIQQPGQREQILKDAILESVHVSVPGEVVSFDANKRTAVIQPVIRRWRKTEPPPLLLDVPVFFPGGNVIDVRPGDGCLVVFADHCIDAWFQNGGVSTPVSARMHDLSDGFAFIGFRTATGTDRASMFTLAVQASASNSVTIHHPWITENCRVMTKNNETVYDFNWTTGDGVLTLTNATTGAGIPAMTLEIGLFAVAETPAQEDGD